MFLTLIETSGNQAFIFATNKLKENIGASELTYRAGTKWMLEAIAAEVAGTNRLSLWTPNGKQLQRNLLDTKLNPPIESESSLGVEIIVAASGKAMLLTQDHSTAQNIIRRVTRQALEVAPGLDVYGVIQESNWDKECMGQTIEQIHRKFESHRNQRVTPQQRFQRLPVVQACTTSGQPASGFSKVYGGKSQAVSETSLAKIRAARDARGRLRSLLNEPGIEFAGTTSELDDVCDWLAIVHADGNGLGKIFQNFHKHIGATSPDDNRDYVNKLRRFSIALDQCTEAAFREAIQVIDTKKHPPSASSETDETDSLPSHLIPLAPLVLGGDDLTVVCDGRYALQFTYAFLKAFEAETASLNYCDGIVPEIAKVALKADRLSACAGVSIIKPHFPFSVAYGLAESLIKSAKTVKQNVKTDSSQDSPPYPCSAIDFHILYDSSVVDLDTIRDRLIVDGAQLHNRPYVITPLERLSEVTGDGRQWCEFHHWSHLSDRIKALTDQDEAGDRQLPSSQMHDLRSSLFLGKAASDAQFALIRKRYDSKKIHVLEGDAETLFAYDRFAADDPKKPNYCTGFLDALESLEFFNIAGENTP